MKTTFALIIIFAMTTFGANAQDSSYKKLKLSGFDITITPSDKASFKFAGPNRVINKSHDGVLDLEAVIEGYGNDTKNTLTIHSSKVSDLELHNCNMTYIDASLGSINISLAAHSKVKILNIQADKISATVDSGAELELSGKATSIDCVVKGASVLTSPNIAVEDIKLDASSASKVTINNLTTTNISLSAKFAANIQLEGTAGHLKSHTDMAVILNAAKLVTQTAAISTERGCMITVNVKNMEEMPEVKNVGNIKKEQNFKDLFKK